MAREQNESIWNPINVSGGKSIYEERKMGSIYFRFDEFELSKDDRDFIDLLVNYVFGTITNNRNIVIRFVGHTDLRGSEQYNIWLSAQRIKKVREYFTYELKEKRVKEDIIESYLPLVEPMEDPRGERHARKESNFWIEDRRVDVFTKTEKRVLSQDHADERECIKQDIWLFTNYYPDIKLWETYKLEYLIYRSLYVYHKMGSLQIKELDLEKVKLLLKTLMNKEEYNRFLIDLESSNDKKAKIEEAYLIRFNHIWNRMSIKYKDVWKNLKTPYKCGGKGRVRSILEYTTKSDSRY